jgi:hypothetical protein
MADTLDEAKAGRAGDPRGKATQRRHPGSCPRAWYRAPQHATVLARAKAALTRIDAGMAQAQRTGVLHEFNQEYRRKRLEAQGKDQRFMGYGQATARLRRAITNWRGASGDRP